MARRVGLTGGIGVGKTTVAACFRQLGVPCFICDEVAKSYYADDVFLAEMQQALGVRIVDDSGRLDKEAMRRCVFHDVEKNAIVNHLVHPKVMADFDAFCTQHAGKPYVLFESAILYEHQLDKLMDAVVCVYVSKAERMSRLHVREQSSREMIERQMAMQWQAEEKMMRADYVVLNYEGNPRMRQVEHIHSLLCGI